LLHFRRKVRHPETFVQSHEGCTDDFAIYGHDCNPTTWRLAAMNLVIHGFDFNLGLEASDTFLSD
jgi:type I restriction enzyme M protein